MVDLFFDRPLDERTQLPRQGSQGFYVITRSRRPGYYHSVRKRVSFSFPSRNAEFRAEQEITVEKIEGAYYTLYWLIPIVKNFFFLIHPRCPTYVKVKQPKDRKNLAKVRSDSLSGRLPLRQFKQSKVRQQWTLFFLVLKNEFRKTLWCRFGSGGKV